MAAANLEKRVDLLEREVQRLKSVIGSKVEENQRSWWERLAGTFKDDPVFDEIVEAGHKYRRRCARQSR